MTSVDDRLEKGREYLRLLRRCLVRTRTITSDLIEPHGVTGPQFLVLYYVLDRAGLMQQELAVEIDSDPNTVSAMVARLEKRGLIDRRRDDHDKRAVRLFPTKSGKALFDATISEVDRLSLHLFQAMPAEHEEAIVAWLTAVAELRIAPVNEA